MKFRAVLQLKGKTATGIEVPANVLQDLDGGRRPPVKVTLNGYTFRTTIGVMGGRSLIPVNADVRAGAHVSAGDDLVVDVSLDHAPREVNIPADFAAALDADSTARDAFNALSYSQKRWYVLPIETAKAADTRRRRVAKAVEMLVVRKGL